MNVINKLDNPDQNIEQIQELKTHSFETTAHNIQEFAEELLDSLYILWWMYNSVESKFNGIKIIISKEDIKDIQKGNSQIQKIKEIYEEKEQTTLQEKIDWLLSELETLDFENHEDILDWIYKFQTPNKLFRKYIKNNKHRIIEIFQEKWFESGSDYEDLSEEFTEDSYEYIIHKFLESTNSNKNISQAIWHLISEWKEKFWEKAREKREKQEKIDWLMESLENLDFSDFENILDWISEFKWVCDYEWININKEKIKQLFESKKWEINLNREELDEDELNNLDDQAKKIYHAEIIIWKFLKYINGTEKDLDQSILNLINSWKSQFWKQVLDEQETAEKLSEKIKSWEY
jgi:hypothetical protein